MNIRLLLCFALGLFACTGATPTAESPTATATATPPPRSTVVLYAFELTLPDGELRGTRLFDDGWVEAHVGPSATPWTPSHQVPPEALTALREALAAPELAALPAQLADGPNPNEQAPPGTWTFLHDGAPRTVSTAHYGGVRIPAFDRIETLLGRSHAKRRLSTTWTYQPEHSDPVVVEVPCQPLTTGLLRALTARLLESGRPPTDNLDQTRPLLTIDWQEAQRTWRTTLTHDHRVVQLSDQGELSAVTLSEAEATLIVDELGKTQWDLVATACERNREKPVQNSIKEPSEAAPKPAEP
jgi:hypothetical protein